MSAGYKWLRDSARYHRERYGNLAMAKRFDDVADELLEAHVARDMAENPGFDETEVRSQLESDLLA